ncbi:MAG: hypothetical protein KDI64_08210, partial [Candidatus Accumulibacter sp.]|nr:hypothetical protein [Accumulibacter sp.]
MRPHQPASLLKPTLLAILLAFPAQQALATACTWDPATGNWNLAGNWSCNAVPGVNDDATIGVGKTVTVDLAQSIRNMTNAGGVDIDAFLLTLSGAGGTTNTGTINVGAGPNPDNAALNVNAGHNIDNTGGVINVSPDSVLNQFGSTITGGTITTTGTGSIVAFNNASNHLSGVTLNGTLDLASGVGRERILNGLTLNGGVTVNSNSILSFEGTQTVGGNGNIVFGNTSGSNRLDLDGDGTTTFGAGITIRGENGTIGQQINIGGTQTLVNEGLISADVSGGAITVTQSAVSNNNLMEARNSGTLILASNVTNSGSGMILADNGLVLQSGQRVTGGAINSANGGLFRATNNANNYLDGTTLNGTLDLATAVGRERVVNGLTLNGTAALNNNSILSFEGTQTVAGGGSIVLGASGASNRIDLDGDGTTTIGSGISIHGQNGTIGQQINIGGTQTLLNNGKISADVSGGTINITQSAVTNSGILEARNGGTLQLSSAVTGGAGGQIVAATGSTVLQNGVTISGVVNTSGTGSFRASNSANNFLSSVDFSGMLDLASAIGIEQVTGGLTLNSATINIAQASTLAPRGDQTIGGTGTIVFADGNASNRLNVEAGNLVLDSGITVRGETGRIGNQSFVGGAATLTNNGTIQADVNAGQITIAVNGLTTNNGTLAALNGGTLNLNSSVQGNLGSQILAGAGSVVAQNGVTISGVVNTSGTGSFRASNSANNFLSSVDFSGMLDMASAIGIEQVTGGLTLNSATINIAQASTLAPRGDQTIGGTGMIVFADGNASNRLNVEAGNLVLDSGITVRGETGRIGNQSFVGGAATLTNNGTIQADVNAGQITIAVNGLTTNNGTLAALNGGTLNLNSAVTGTTGSQILAGAGSVVAQNGVAISGDMNLTGPGSFRASNSASNFLSGVTLAGTLDLASAIGIERVAGGLTLDGATINIGNNSILAPQGDQIIGGTGSIVFADASSSNRLNVEAGNLILGAGVSVRGGNGFIGQQAFVGGGATLTNQGLISADVAGRSITLGVSGQVINENIMEARNGGQLTLNAGGGYDNSAGTMLAEGGSTVLFNGTAVTGGVLNSNGSGKFVASNSSVNFLNGTILNGALDMASAVGIERISAGGMTLNGAINIGSGSILAPQGDQTIGGNGSIVFADGNASNRLNVEAGNLTIGNNVTVRGQTGYIGQQAFAGGAATLTNNGTINADSGGTITVNVTGALTNNGTMRAQNGTLLIQDGLAGTGTLQVDSTGVTNLANTPNTQGKLVMGAAGSTLNIGTQNLTITNDYTNVASGSGNNFDRRAGVSGAGQIVAGGDAAQAITGSSVTDGNTANATMTIGNVRVGTNNLAYQIANTGSSGPQLRGAVQTSVNGANLTDSRLGGAGVTAGNY